MSDHKSPASSGEKKSSHSGGESAVEGLVMGMHELMHKSGLGAFADTKDSIGHLFGVEGGGSHGGGSHEKKH